MIAPSICVAVRISIRSAVIWFPYNEKPSKALKSSISIEMANSVCDTTTEGTGGCGRRQHECDANRAFFDRVPECDHVDYRRKESGFEDSDEEAEDDNLGVCLNARKTYCKNAPRAEKCRH